MRMSPAFRLLGCLIAAAACGAPPASSSSSASVLPPPAPVTTPPGALALARLTSFVDTALVRTSTGLAALWSNMDASGWTLHLQALDTQGEPVGAPVLVLTRRDLVRGAGPSFAQADAIYQGGFSLMLHEAVSGSHTLIQFDDAGTITQSRHYDGTHAVLVHGAAEPQVMRDSPAGIQLTLASDDRDLTYLPSSTTSQVLAAVQGDQLLALTVDAEGNHLASVGGGRCNQEIPVMRATSPGGNRVGPPQTQVVRLTWTGTQYVLLWTAQYWSTSTVQDVFLTTITPGTGNTVETVTLSEDTPWRAMDLAASPDGLRLALAGPDTGTLDRVQIAHPALMPAGTCSVVSEGPADDVSHPVINLLPMGDGALGVLWVNWPQSESAVQASHGAGTLVFKRVTAGVCGSRG